MTKLSIAEINSELKTDTLNKIFRDISVDVNDVYEQITTLNTLYNEQATNINVINLYRSQLYSLANTLSTNSQSYEANGLKLYHIDANTATTTYTNTSGSYGSVTLSASNTYNRFPTTTDIYGNNVPLYNSVFVYKDDVYLDENELFYYALTEDNRRVYIEDLGSSADVEYRIQSNASTPKINSVVIAPVFGGMTNISDLSYGFDTNWYNIGSGTFNSMYAREFIFKQRCNSTGVKFTLTPTPLSTNYYAGFYNIRAYYKIFESSGTVRFEKTIPIGTYQNIRTIDIDYDFFDPIENIPNLFSKLFRIQIYDNTTSTLLYDSNLHQYPYTTSEAPISMVTGNLIVVITINRYDDVSPIFNYLSLGVD